MHLELINPYFSPPLVKGSVREFILNTLSKVAASLICLTFSQFLVSHGCFSKSFNSILFFGSFVNIFLTQSIASVDTLNLVISS